jgi:hypothetical protein
MNGSVFAPFKHRVFTVLWIATLISRLARINLTCAIGLAPGGFVLIAVAAVYCS